MLKGHPKELYLLVNPISGRGVAAQAAHRVLRTLKAQGWTVHPYRCYSETATPRFVQKLPPDTIVAALGGDGFIRNVAKGCLAGGQILAPLPGGRGNDLCRYLGISTNPVEACWNLSVAREKLLDVGYANDEPFLGTACMGFDGFANKAANNAKFVTSNVVYVWGAIKTLITYRALGFHIESPAGKRDEKLYMVDVCDSGRYGGGVIASPTSKMDDGLLDLITWRPVHRVRFLTLVRKAFRGQHVQASEVEQQKVPWVNVSTTAKKPVPIYADGDHVANLPARFRVKMGQLRVLA